MFTARPFPALPIDVFGMETQGVVVPTDLKAASGYREFLLVLEAYAHEALAALRAVNPNTRDRQR